MTKKAFLSVLTDNSYLPGLLVLQATLKKVGSRYPLHVLLTSNISRSTILSLEKKLISYKILEQKEIKNPTNIDKNHRWFSTYSKLFAFDKGQFDKIVYIDADTMLLRNIDELFDFRHMSAVNAGGMIPEKSSWTHLNSGLMVIEPSNKLFKDMISKIGLIEPLQSEGTITKPKYGSDQDFLNAYYSKWPRKKNLHLDHKYNIIYYFIDKYCKLFGYTLDKGDRQISVIHFASYLKPWNINEANLSELRRDKDRQVELQSIQLWLDEYKTISK